MSSNPNILGGFTPTPSGASSLIGVVTPSSTDNAITRWDGTTGTLVQNSAVTIADTTGAITIRTTQVLAVPDQTGLIGSLIVGTGGGSLVNTSGTDGQGNTFVGVSCGTNTTTGEDNVGVGYNVLRQNISGDNNCALGRNALLANTTGSNNTAVGRLALTANTDGTDSCAFGANALVASTTGVENNAFGFNSLKSNTDGDKNCAFGRNSLQANTIGINNSAFGNNTLFANVSGNNNTAVGIATLNANATGSDNAALGHDALLKATDGQANVAMGYRPLYEMLSGDDNVALGHSAGEFIADGSTPLTVADDSIFLGAATKANADSETNQVVIGYGAVGAGSNTVVLGADTITKTVLKGTIAATGSDSVMGGSAAGAVRSKTSLIKSVTAIADNVATAVATVTIPNAAHSATVRVKLTGSLGAGGAVGANEATGTIGYDFAVARTAGVNAVTTISAAYGSATAAVAGAATITISAAASAISGAVGASNTFTVNVTIAKGSGSSDNHTCLVYAEVINANASGVTIA